MKTKEETKRWLYEEVLRRQMELLVYSKALEIVEGNPRLEFALSGLYNNKYIQPSPKAQQVYQSIIDEIVKG